MIEIQSGKELPIDLAYRAFAVRGEQDAAVIANGRTVYYWRKRNILFVPVGKIEVVKTWTDIDNEE